MNISARVTVLVLLRSSINVFETSHELSQLCSSLTSEHKRADSHRR
jgi:hypothetical protein